MSNLTPIYRYLAYIGALPFVLCALFFLIGWDYIPILGNIEKILSLYSLTIASFMAGSHWGQHINIDGKWSLYLPISSNINAIILWIAYLILPFKGLIIIFIMSLLWLLYIDKKLLHDHIIRYDYFRTRCFVTVIVTIALILSRLYA